MDWHDAQTKLLTAARQIRQNSVLDAATVALLDQVPIVGKFLTRYWDNATRETESPDAMAAFIEAIARQESTFENLSRKIEEQGDLLIAQGSSLGDILLGVDQIRDDVSTMKTQINAFVATLSIPSAKAAFERAAAMGEDLRRSRGKLEEAERLLQQAGHEADAPTFSSLGMLYLSMNEFDRAEACLLRAVELQPELSSALVGLAMIYQRRANDALRQENFGLAEATALRSEGYIKTALEADPTDFGLQVHLGYVYKDLAMRYAGLGRDSQATTFEERAWKSFEGALKIDADDASAENGLGSICLIRGDYDAAIVHVRRALELQPSNLFASFDLAQAYRGQASVIQDPVGRLEALTEEAKAILRTRELDGQAGGDSLPPHAREALQRMAEELQTIDQQ
jgi:tetratricopeptide (TPR) repeat protein